MNSESRPDFFNLCKTYMCVHMFLCKSNCQTGNALFGVQILWNIKLLASKIQLGTFIGSMSGISADKLETLICIALMLVLEKHYSSHVSRCWQLQFWLQLFLPWVWPVVLMISLWILFRLFVLLVACWIQLLQSSRNTHSSEYYPYHMVCVMHGGVLLC